MFDLILLNANALTMDPLSPQASWIAVRDGIIVEVARDGRFQYPAAEGALVIDCRGRTVLPGFIDAHGHVQAYAEQLVSLDLSPRGGIASMGELQDRLRQYAGRRAPGTWIRGKGYDEFSLAEGRHPTRWDLDTATSSHPVKLTHRSGHAHVLNSLALKQVGISAQTGDPDGGLIDRDLDTVEPTGILYGMGGFLANRIPALSETDITEGISLASQKLLSYGITSVQDASAYNDFARWRQFEYWKAQRLFIPRLTLMMGEKGFDARHDRFHTTCIDDTQLKAGGVKIIVHEVTGRLHPRREELNEQVLAIHKAGHQVIIHAVEEAAIESACDAIAYALRTYPDKDRRHRIEHGSLCPPHLADRLNDLGVAVVTQPPFIFYSGDRYLRAVPPEKQDYLYPLGTMLRKGLTIGASSDFPVVDPDPFIGLYSAVTRRSEKGHVIGKNEGITPMDALKMYTVSAATANFEENIKGSISPGKVADLVILSEDPLQVDVRSIKDIQIEMTIQGGKVVYGRC